MTASRSPAQRSLVLLPPAILPFQWRRRYPPARLPNPHCATADASGREPACMSTCRVACTPLRAPQRRAPAQAGPCWPRLLEASPERWRHSHATSRAPDRSYDAADLARELAEAGSYHGRRQERQDAIDARRASGRDQAHGRRRTRRARRPCRGRALNPHGLRAIMVTLALDSGMPLRDVQDSARHADPAHHAPLRPRPPQPQPPCRAAARPARRPLIESAPPSACRARGESRPAGAAILARRPRLGAAADARR